MLKAFQREGVVEAGCDEAGRGCLAGDVYAAAVEFGKAITRKIDQLSAQSVDAILIYIPEDYEAVMLKGRMYYSVDNTVYRLIVSGGKPYLEVLGMQN